ncbi:MAG: DUF2070 family protein [Methanolinea sp.]|nr:DUF2070 family protein [Methanolinea sp.]
MRLESLARYLFNAPSWPASILILCVFGLILDVVTQRLGTTFLLGTLGFTLPGLFAFIATKPLVTSLGRPMTWNRSALLALSCAIFGLFITLLGLLISPLHLALSYAVALGFTLGLRLLVLVAIADFRILRMIVPAATQSGMAILLGMHLFPPVFLPLSLLVQGVFCAGFAGVIWLIERPLYRTFHIRVLDFLNSFLAHLTDGSRALEEYFEKIGEEVTVPQVSIFFSRKDRRGLLITIPNVHPGPLGEIGGGNIPRGMQEGFDEMVMVPHGAATHDFNPVSEKEIGKLVEAVRRARNSLRFSPLASRSVRVREGSVSLLCQVFDSTLLLVGTRSPERTEDIDFGVGMMIMGEGHRNFENVGFIDAHNCQSGETLYVLPASRLAMEYYWAGMRAINEMVHQEKAPMEVGIAQVKVPFSREQGFGDQGIQVAIVRTGGQSTAYILVDGNNMEAGVREALRDHVLSQVDEAEIMTTDSHVVNTVRGRNPVGLHVPVRDIIPWVDRALREAREDLSPALAAGSTAWCEGVKVFGSHRITQMASTVNTMLIFIPFISAGMLVLTFLLSLLAYIVLG